MVLNLGAFLIISHISFTSPTHSSGAATCTACPLGKTSFTTGATSDTVCVHDAHSWNFMGCSDDSPVVDETVGSALAATAFNGASCSAGGMVFDGVDDYVDLEDWEWGGTMSIEVYVKYDSFNSYSRVFDFSSGSPSNNVFLNNVETTSTLHWDVRQGSTVKYLTTSNFDSSTWTHVVVTVSGNTMKIYKNGVLGGTKTDGWEPDVLTRTNHIIGNRAENDRAFDGTIAYLKTWHGVELIDSNVADLYASHNTAHHFWDFRGCTTGDGVTDGIAGDLVATSMNGPTCTAYGIALDGSNDYLDISGWEWGGATSFEVYVKYNVFNYYSRVFDFGSG